MRKQKIIIDDLINNGKIPPQAVDLETAVLGGCMLEKGAYDRAATLINSNDFYTDGHKLIFATMQELAAANKPIDILTVSNNLRDLGNLELVGGLFYISTLTNNVSSTANLETHCLIVKQKSVHRRFIQALSESQSKAWDETTDIFELIKTTQTEIDNLVLSKSKSQLIKIGETANKVYLETEKQKNNPQELIGLKSSLKEINLKLMGYNAPDLIIVAGRPGEGKSTFALNEALTIATNGSPVLFFSLEMNDRQLCWKVISNQSNIDVLRIRSGNVNDSELKDIAYNSEKLNNTPLYLTDGINNLNDIKSLARHAKKHNNIEFIVIDYLGLISFEIAGASREQVVSEITRQLKLLCLELNICIMLLAQLNRPQKGVTVKQPTIFDLKESGAVESNADVIIFPYRPFYWGNTNVAGYDIDFDESMAIIDIAKQRLGTTGEFLAGWNGKYNRFENFEDRGKLLNEVFNPNNDYWNI